MIHWENATDWEMQLPAQAGDIFLSREGNVLRLHPERGADQTLELVAPSDTSLGLAELQSQFAGTASQYHYFIENSPKRLKVTYLLLGDFPASGNLLCPVQTKPRTASARPEIPEYDDVGPRWNLAGRLLLLNSRPARTHESCVQTTPADQCRSE